MSDIYINDNVCIIFIYIVCMFFGKVIIPFENIFDRRDLSMGKVGVITSRTKWINKEVQICVNGAVYCVGVVEYTDDWSPFKPCQFDKVEDVSDSEGSENDTEDDGISETWIPEDDNDLEEGEFRFEGAPETQLKMTNKHVESGNSPANVRNTNDAPVELTGVIPQEEVNEGFIRGSVEIPHVMKEVLPSEVDA